MNEAGLGLQAADWLRLVAGLAVFLLPGVAAADRWLVGLPLRWLWAPVLSFTVLALAAIILGYVVGLQVTPAATWMLAVGLAAWIGRRRWVGWVRRGLGSGART